MRRDGISRAYVATRDHRIFASVNLTVHVIGGLLRFIPTRVHGILAYLVALALLASPWLFGYAANETARWVSIAIGAGAILYSLLTDFELGIVKAMPMPAHLTLDVHSGGLLAASPWLFGFSDDVWLPHVMIGLFEIGAAVMTRTVPDHETLSANDHHCGLAR